MSYPGDKCKLCKKRPLQYAGAGTVACWDCDRMDLWPDEEGRALAV